MNINAIRQGMEKCDGAHAFDAKGTFFEGYVKHQRDDGSVSWRRYYDWGIRVGKADMSSKDVAAALAALSESGFRIEFQNNRD